MPVSEFFQTVTPAQAEIVSSLANIVTVILAAILAPVVFHLITRRGVADFKTAIQEVTVSANRVRDTTGAMAKDISALRERLSDINEILSVVQKNVAISRSNSDEETQALETGTNEPSEVDQNTRARLKNAWSTLRDKLENVASDPTISGHARARYGRLDRRDYRLLIDVLYRDSRLGNDRDNWHEAAKLWYTYRPNNQPINVTDLERLEALAASLSSAVYQGPDKEIGLAERIQLDACAGRIPMPLTPALIHELYPDYAITTTRTVLANYSEGGYFQSIGQLPRFRSKGDGGYEAICSPEQTSLI